MGSLNKDEREKLEKALAASYRNRVGPEPGEEWETGVMNSIRSMPADAKENFTWADMFGSMFWRICPVACAIIIFLAVAVYRYDVIPAPEQDFVQIGVDDAVEMILLDPDNG